MTRHARAFTLIELIIVLSVAAILAGVAAPRYASSLANYRVLLAARRVAADLGAARASARAASASRTVTIAQGAGSYTITSLARLDNRAGTYQVDLSGSPYCCSISTLTLPSAATSGQIVFDGYGVADTSATIAVSSGGRTRTVTLDAATGTITVQ
jgi:prepilin-type N-terminal cleavage/methylation domain-containing protein